MEFIAFPLNLKQRRQWGHRQRCSLETLPEVPILLYLPMQMENPLSRLSWSLEPVSYGHRPAAFLQSTSSSLLKMAVLTNGWWEQSLQTAIAGSTRLLLEARSR